MARLPRMVMPGMPHHVTQRGNGRQKTFFEDGDYALYLDLLAQAAERHGVEVWSYCLMPNHVHIVAVPRDPHGLGQTFSQVHRTYTGYINARRRTTGHLWQGRFGSVAMDEAHFVTALRYVALNPVRARLVAKAEDWPWSSTRALLTGADDQVVKVAPARKAESVGRPVGSAQWLETMEVQTGLSLVPQKRGPKPKLHPLKKGRL
jgi:putative transposase